MSAGNDLDIPFFLLRTDREAVAALSARLLGVLDDHYTARPQTRVALLEAAQAFALPVAAILSGPEGGDLRAAFLRSLEAALGTVPRHIADGQLPSIVDLPAFLRRH